MPSANENNKDPKKDRTSKDPKDPPPPPVRKTPSLQSQTSSIKTVAEHPGMNRTPTPTDATDMNVELCPQTVRDKGFNVLNIELGQGKFSKVYKATWNNDGHLHDIAAKLIRYDNVESSWREGQLKNELKITKKLKHPNIINIIDVFKTRRRAFIFMEKAETSLDDVLKKEEYKDGLDEWQVQQFFHQILQAMVYLHKERGIAHRDLKTDNILLDKNNQCKLTDFGFATYTRLDNEAAQPTKVLNKTACGTPEYMALELHEQKKEYDASAADMWSVGVILHELLYNRFPFQFMKPNGEQIPIEQILGQMRKSIKPPPDWYNRKISKEVRDLIRGLLEPDPKKRLTAEQALQSDWFKMKIDRPPPKPPANPTKDDKKTPPNKK